MNRNRFYEALAKAIMWIAVLTISILYFSEIMKTFPGWLQTALVTIGWSMFVILEFFMPTRLAGRKFDKGLKYLDKDNDKAVRYLEDYLGTGLLDISERSNTLRILGVAYQKKGDTDKAIDSLKESLLGFERDSEQKIEVLGAMGIVYSEAGEYQKAVEHFDRTFELIFSLSKAHIDKAALLLAMNAYIMAGKSEKAVDIYDRLLMIHGFKRDRRVEELLQIKNKY